MKPRAWLLVFAGLATLAAAPAEGQNASQRRGWLGITYVVTDVNGTETVRVEQVYPRSPAAGAGLRDGDVIVRWNDRSDVEDALAGLALQPGDTVRLRVRRGSDRDRDVLVIAAERPREIAVLVPRAGQRVEPMQREELEKLRAEMRRNREEMRRNGEEIARALGEARVRSFHVDSLARFWGDRIKLDSLAIHADSLHKGIQLLLRDSLGPRLEALGDELRILVPQGPTRTVFALGNRSVAGAEFEEMNPGLSRYFGTDEGLLVLRVGPGTPAARAGLQPGDVILEVNERPVDSVDDIRDAVARAQGSRTRSVLLQILREGRRQEADLSWE